MRDGTRGHVGRLELDGRRIGTAFQLLPDGMGITALHVLVQAERASPGDELHLVVGTGPAISRRCEVTDRIDPEHDLAVIDLQPPISAPPLMIRTWDGGLAGAPVVVHGFGALDDAEHDYGFLPTAGELWGVVERDGVLLLVVNAKGVLQGMSGAPVLLAGTNQLVGVVSGRYNSTDSWYRDSVWIAPAAHISVLAGERLAAGLVAQAEGDLSRGDYDLALAKVDDVLKLQATNVAALLVRARVHLLQERFGAAQSDVASVLRFQPENVKALALRSAIHLGRGDRAAAQSDLETVLERAPSDAFVVHLQRLLGL
jgi:trypsin-like peptidase